MPDAGSAVVLVPGDGIRVAVWRQAELSGEFMIAADSTLRHPLYRAVKVAGVPMQVVEQRMRSYLQQLEASPQFVLEPLLHVTVSGEVRSPSIYTLPPEVTVAQAVVRAGGATQTARTNHVRLRRNGREYVVDLTYPDLETAQTPIRSGDQIIVPRRTNVFRDQVLPVMGTVSSVSSFVYLVFRAERLLRR
ncbi:hypothetical protein BH23GEM7_BH23GEM7_36130 [soil metagenome]